MVTVLMMFSSRRTATLLSYDIDSQEMLQVICWGCHKGSIIGILDVVNGLTTNNGSWVMPNPPHMNFTL